MLRALLFLTLLTTATTSAQWTLQDAHTTADLRGIDNVGHGVAWASGTDGTILRTEDAGFVWQLCAKPPGGEHLDFRAIQHRFTVLVRDGRRKRCTHSAIGEPRHRGHLLHFAAFSVRPLRARTASSGVFSLLFRPDSARPFYDCTHGVAVGGDYLHSDIDTRNAVFSSDGGQHWTAAATPPHGYRSAVAYDAATKTWITVGPNGTNISTDDGRNWRPLKPDPKFNEAPDADQHWNALSLPYAVGPHGRIATLRPSALQPSSK